MKKSRELPLINVRDLVLFPKMQISLYIGRKFTIDAIQNAKIKHKGRLLVFSQKKSENECPSKKSDMHPVGAECKILNSVLLPDNTMKVLLEVVDTVQLTEVSITNDVRTAKAEILPSTPIKLTEKERRELIQLLIVWDPLKSVEKEQILVDSIVKEKNATKFLSLVFRAFCSPKTSKATKFPSHPNNKSSKIINQKVTERQLILGEKNGKKRVKMLKALMKKECLEMLDSIAV